MAAIPPVGGRGGILLFSRNYRRSFCAIPLRNFFMAQRLRFCLVGRGELATSEFRLNEWVRQEAVGVGFSVLALFDGNEAHFFKLLEVVLDRSNADADPIGQVALRGPTAVAVPAELHQEGVSKSLSQAQVKALVLNAIRHD